MNAIEIKEGNRLIALFMAAKNEDGSLYNNKAGGYPIGTLHFNTPNLPVNTLYPEGHEYFDGFYGQWERNWSWLMPVVEKIETMGQTIIEIGKKHCRIQPILYNKQTDSMQWELMHEFSSNTKIEATWQTVVSFIQWYSSLNK